MDEQFSQEYIAFMQEAAGLQKLWVPGAGDWAWADEDIKAVLLVNVWPPQREGGLPTIEAAVYGEDLGPCSYEFIEGEITWLPSLFQLLRIIEKAGWRWGAEMLTERKGPGGRYTEYRIGAEREEDKDSLLCLDNWEEGDLMLAAAKLAARAVEDKG